MRRIVKYILGTHIFLLYSFFLNAQVEGEGSEYSPDNTFEIDKLQEDFKVLTTTLQEAHPGLYWYTSKEELTAIFDSTSRLISSEMTDLDFYRILAPLIAKVNCGHTRIYNSLDYRKYQKEKNKYFPLELFLKDGKVYTLKNYGDEKIKSGYEVVSINGKNIQDILTKIYQAQYSDGNIRSFQRYKIQHNFYWLYEVFVEESKDFEVKLKTNDKDTLVTFGGLDYYDIYKRKKSAYKNELLDLTLDKSAKIATLRINSFSNKDFRREKLRFSSFLKNTFKTLRKKRMKYLIIDLRGNGGGSIANGYLLYSYLAKEKFKYFQFKEVAGFPNYTYKEHLNSSSSFVDRDDIVKTDSGYYMRATQASLNIQKPKKKRFKGEIYILTNGMSFSTTAQFSSMVKSNQLATFIGEETGGTYNGCTAGRICYLILPNTKLRVNIPQIRYLMSSADENNKGQGIIPHYPIEPSIGGILQEKDEIMDFTLQLIEKK